MNICLKYILSRPGETWRCSNDLLEIFTVADFRTQKKSWEVRETCFWRNRFLGCGTTVGGAGDPNHSAWGRFLVFSLAMSLFHEIFLSPAFAGFLRPKLGFRPKGGLCVSRSGELGLSQPGEILGRETPVWAAQARGGFGKHTFC